MKQEPKPHGAAGFMAYYAALYGARWEGLEQALREPCAYATLRLGGTQDYHLDPASVCAALAVPVRTASAVLDMCAAPGGKTLVMAANLPGGAELCANELSADRAARLSRVVAECLAPPVAAHVRVRCGDAATLCRSQPERYGCILLDAPCSSERHVLNDAHHLAQWTPARIRHLAVTQWALLSSAWRMLAPGGYVLYATCALAPQENDGIIERLVKKFPSARVCPQEEVCATVLANLAASGGNSTPPPDAPGAAIPALLDAAARTERGLHILPDTAQGCGPLYFALVQKPAAG